MYKEALRSIEGIQIYPIISLAIFGLFFIGLIIWVLNADKKYIEEMSNLPIK
jgi:cbb3-type cytochrome oxidase subunit 3